VGFGLAQHNRWLIREQPVDFEPLPPFFVLVCVSLPIITRRNEVSSKLENNAQPQRNAERSGRSSTAPCTTTTMHPDLQLQNLSQLAITWRASLASNVHRV
jgi:hypothetical protein